MSIKQKLIIIPIIALLLFTGTIIFSWQNQQQLLITIEKVSLFEQQAMYLQMLLRGVNESLLTETSIESVQFAQKGQQGFEKTLDELLQYHDNENRTELLTTEILPLWNRVKQELTPFLEQGGIQDRNDDIMMQYGRILGVSDQLNNNITNLANQSKKAASETIAYLTTLNVSSAVLFLIILAIVFYHLYMTIAKPINKIRTIVQEIPSTALNVDDLTQCHQQLTDDFPQNTSRNEVHALSHAIRFMLTTIENYIHEQYRTEQALQRSRHMLQLVIDHIPEFIYWKDKEGQYQGCSVNYARLLGFSSPNDLLTKTDTELSPADKQGEFYHQQDLAALKQGKQSLHRLEQRAGNGQEEQWLDISQIPLRDEQDDIIGLLVCHEDITPRRRAELGRETALKALEEERSLLARRVAERTAELSRANAQLGRASRLKDEFLANMSHELRTPLNAILGIAEVLQEGVYGEITPKQAKSLQTLEESGRHLLSLINDILDLAKVEAGKMGLDCQTIDLKRTCESCLRLVKEIATKKQIKLECHLDELVNYLYADERRLKQIIVNLLSNAVKFTSERGTVRLITKGDTELGTVHIMIEDTGIGISEQNIGRLFNPFEQLDTGFTRSHEGTGLGLSLVYRLVEMHTGSVTVESEVGKGSRFSVLLPWDISNEQAISPTKTTTTAKTYRNKTNIDTPDKVNTLVLVVEDNPSNVETLSDYLTSRGYEIIVAWNGQEAIEKALDVKPDIILMDIQMPVLDGLEATRILREKPETQTTPIIALTALAMPNDRERCLAVGINEYLSKPVSFRKLIAAMTQLLTKTEPA